MEFKCSKCGKKFDYIPFKCNYCKNLFCDKCRLPEDHDCYAFQLYMDKLHKTWEETIIDALRKPKKERVYGIKEKRLSFFQRIRKWLKI